MWVRSPTARCARVKSPRFFAIYTVVIPLISFDDAFYAPCCVFALYWRRRRRRKEEVVEEESMRGMMDDSFHAGFEVVVIERGVGELWLPDFAPGDSFVVADAGFTASTKRDLRGGMSLLCCIMSSHCAPFVSHIHQDHNP